VSCERRRGNNFPRWDDAGLALPPPAEGKDIVGSQKDVATNKKSKHSCTRSLPESFIILGP